MLAIRIHEVGGPEKLRTDDIPLPAPAAGQLRIRVEAVGINYVDTYFRSGLYPVELPHLLGQEAAGVVTALGNGVTDFRLGDRIATAHASGAYALETIVAAEKAVPVPNDITSELAAAVMLQGMTAHYLACDTFPLKAGDVALVHAGAGGVGLLLTQIAKMRGARVITTVGTDAKAKLSREAGADEVCVYTREDFVEAVRSFTGGRGADVVYDAVGASTFEGTLKSLRTRRMFVSYVNASGPVSPFSPLVLSKNGSLFFTRPSLAHYTITTAELRARANDLFSWMEAGKMKVRIGATYPLAAAADAHRALEGRQTTGKVLLLP